MSHPHEYQPASAGNPHRKGHHSRGKYNKRGRGRGHRGGRPAIFQEPLLLEGERSEQASDAEEAADAEPDVPHTLGTNADRYEEPEPELGPDGMSRTCSRTTLITWRNLANRTTDRGTRNRFKCVSRAATSRGSTWIVTRLTYLG